MNQFMNINVSKKAGQKGGSSRSNRRGVQPSRLNFPCFQLSPGVARVTHGIAFPTKILLLQCALHRLLRPHCVWGAYSKTCAMMHTKRKTAEKCKKDTRASRAYSPFTPIRFSRVHAFPSNPTQVVFKA